MNSNIKLVIFDLDGTLVDAFKAVTDSVNHALEAMGYPSLSFEDVKKSVGWGERILITKFVKQDDIDKTLSIFRQHHRFALKTGVKFLPGAKELIKDLKSNGFQLAIASNRPTRFTHIILKQLHVLDFFDYVLCADKVENPKPAGDMIEYILGKLDCSKDQAIYVGDMAIDVQAGNDAKVKTVAVTTGSHTITDIEEFEPYAVIEHLEKMTEILENMSEIKKVD